MKTSVIHIGNNNNEGYPGVWMKGSEVILVWGTDGNPNRRICSQYVFNVAKWYLNLYLFVMDAKKDGSLHVRFVQYNLPDIHCYVQGWTVPSKKNVYVGDPWSYSAGIEIPYLHISGDGVATPRPTSNPTLGPTSSPTRGPTRSPTRSPTSPAVLACMYTR